MGRIGVVANKLFRLFCFVLLCVCVCLCDCCFVLYCMIVPFPCDCVILTLCHSHIVCCSRPGVLILINENDWELEGGLKAPLKANDSVLFISTLHGG